MAKYREALPQRAGGLLLTDGGIETTLIFHDGFDLPLFAAFPLLDRQAGRAGLARYYERFIPIARDRGIGFLLESPTWRASADWGDKLGYAPAAVDAANRAAIALMEELRARYETATTPMVVSGCVGPRRDGYRPDLAMTADEAEQYHSRQIDVFGEAGVDLVTAITMTNTEEAIGVTRAAKKAGLPVVISFTVETDGRLPTGQRLADAIEAVDAATARGPAYFMINCAHPAHFAHELSGGGAWLSRLGGLRANASTKSHAELDEATELDAGDPDALAREYADLRRRLPQLTVLGGCCGTDHRHVEQICRAALAPAPS